MALAKKSPVVIPLHLATSGIVENPDQAGSAYRNYRES